MITSMQDVLCPNMNVGWHAGIGQQVSGMAVFNFPSLGCHLPPSQPSQYVQRLLAFLHDFHPCTVLSLPIGYSSLLRSHSRTSVVPWVSFGVGQQRCQVPERMSKVMPAKKAFHHASCTQILPDRWPISSNRKMRSTSILVWVETTGTDGFRIRPLSRSPGYGRSFRG